MHSLNTDTRATTKHLEPLNKRSVGDLRTSFLLSWQTIYFYFDRAPLRSLTLRSMGPRGSCIKHIQKYISGYQTIKCSLLNKCGVIFTITTRVLQYPFPNPQLSVPTVPCRLCNAPQTLHALSALSQRRFHGVASAAAACSLSR